MKISGGTHHPSIDGIDRLTVGSVLLRVLDEKGGGRAWATGFVYKSAEREFLVTNWHVVTGKNSESGEPMDPKKSDPHELEVHFRSREYPSTEISTDRIALFDDDGEMRWREHRWGRALDVVAIPLSGTPRDAQVFTLSEADATVDVVPWVASPAHVVGFMDHNPDRKALAVWKTGHIASEPSQSRDGLPMFLLDATAREGMSGSPVYLRMSGSYRTSDCVVQTGGPVTKWIGVYSGRTKKDSELCRVWRPSVLEEITAGRVKD